MHGIQLVPEDRRIIPGMTVEENLDLAASPVSRLGLRAHL
jgi:ABC-type branched-subunit amino acid transport system ATPase component